MELTKEEMRIAILAFTLQRDVEDSIDKDDPTFDRDEVFIKDLNSLINKFETYLKGGETK